MVGNLTAGIEIVRQYNFMEWRAYNGTNVYDVLLSVPNHLDKDSRIMASPGNRLAPEDVGCPVFDY